MFVTRPPSNWNQSLRRPCIRNCRVTNVGNELLTLGALLVRCFFYIHITLQCTALWGQWHSACLSCIPFLFRSRIPLFGLYYISDLLWSKGYWQHHSVRSLNNTCSLVVLRVFTTEMCLLTFERCLGESTPACDQQVPLTLHWHQIIGQPYKDHPSLAKYSSLNYQGQNHEMIIVLR